MSETRNRASWKKMPDFGRPLEAPIWQALQEFIPEHPEALQHLVPNGAGELSVRSEFSPDAPPSPAALRQLFRLQESEERRLVRIWKFGVFSGLRARPHERREALRRLLCASLWILALFARRYLSSRVPAADLIQEGALGFWVSLKEFRPERGTRLATYASVRMRSRMRDLSMRHLRWSRPENGAGDADFDEAPSAFSPLESLLSAESSAALSEKLSSALERLSWRERQIISARMLSDPPLPLAVLSEEFGLSAARICQLHQRALRRLREILSEDAP